jgi:hypothetical protein
MPLKLRNNLPNNTDRIPSGLRKLDVQRARERNKRNFSLKIQKLYSSTASSLVGNFIGTETFNIIGTENLNGIGIEDQS